MKDGLTLVKMHELLERSGTVVPYRTLARFAAAECGYSSSARQQVTVPVADGKPGEEVQLDFGYLGMIADGDRRRKLHALVFTAALSRYCFVYLTFSQTTAAVIAGCEAAWAFFGGMFKVLVPDNLKPVVDKADRLEPRWNREWLGYAQARGLVVDPARVRSPQDKGRVENGVKFAQRSFFAGEDFAGIEDAQRRAVHWCRVRAGMRVHGTTRQRPAEVFAQVEAPALLPALEQPYRVPAWSEAKVQRDFHLRAGNAFYSVPYRLAGQQVTVRADGTLVKIYHRGQVIRTHPQQPAGGRASDPADFPPGTDVYARRDAGKLARMAAARGEAIGIYAARILDTPLPWTRMPAVYALIGLARTYGSDPVEQACAAALELDVISVGKIKSIVEKGTGKQAAQAAARSRQAGHAAAKGHRGPVRPRSPRVRHLHRRAHAGPAGRQSRRRGRPRHGRGLTARAAGSGIAPAGAIHLISFPFIALHRVLFRFAVPGTRRRGPRPMTTITTQPQAAATPAGGEAAATCRYPGCCTASKLIALCPTWGSYDQLRRLVVLVDNAVEHHAPLDRQVQRRAGLAVLVGRPLLAGLVRAVPVVVAGVLAED